MVDRRRKLHSQIIEQLTSERPEVLPVEIPASTLLEQMGVRRAPIEVYAAHSAPAAAYRRLWEEVSSRL